MDGRLVTLPLDSEPDFVSSPRPSGVGDSYRVGSEGAIRVYPTRPGRRPGRTRVPIELLSGDRGFPFTVTSCLSSVSTSVTNPTVCIPGSILYSHLLWVLVPKPPDFISISTPTTLPLYPTNDPLVYSL